MRKLGVFNHVSLDGYFAGANGDFNWARQGNDDPEYSEFVAENAGRDGVLLFGRVTYEMMAGFWPTAAATQHAPAVAEGMNRMPKVVFSRTLDKVSWQNTRLVKADLISEVRRMKAEPGADMAILGSGSIVSQLAQAGLVDEFQVMVNPVVLGQGRTMFADVRDKVSLTLTKTRVFRNGKVFLSYAPAA